MSDLSDHFRKADEALRDLILSRDLPLWLQVSEVVINLRGAITEHVRDEGRRAFGHGWQEGYDRGTSDGWQDRDHAASLEWITAQAEHDSLRAQLVAAEKRLRRYERVPIGSVETAADIDAAIGDKAITH